MTSIIVVGGGMVGAAAALGLAQQNHQVVLLDKFEPKAWTNEQYGQRVSAISPHSAALLQQLGVWQTIAAARISPYTEMRVWDDGGEGQIHFTASEVQLPELGAIIENDLIVSELWQAMRANSKIRIITGASWQTLQNNATGTQLLLDTGEELNADLLIAADGGQSAIRKQLNIDWQSRNYQQFGLVATVSTSLNHKNTAWQRFCDQGVIAFLPLADGRCSIVWSTDNDQANILSSLPDELFTEELKLASQGALGDITAIESRGKFPLQAGIAESFIHNRVILIGDAAHTVHPLAGQGVNIGFGDVSELLSQLNTGITTAALRKYSRQRRLASAKMIAGIDGLQRLFASKQPSTRLIRRFGLNLLNGRSILKSLIIQQAN